MRRSPAEVWQPQLTGPAAVHPHGIFFGALHALGVDDRRRGGCLSRDAMGPTVAPCHHRRWKRWSALMAQQLDDLSRSPTPLDQDSTIITVIEMSQATWLVAGIVPGIERHPLKKIEPNEVDLVCLLMRWRSEAMKKGRTITRIVVAFEA